MTVEEIAKLGISQELAQKVFGAVEAEYVKSGNYIPKAKFDQVLAEKSQLKSQVDQASADLAKLKKEAEGNDALRQTIENLQKQHKDLEAQHKAELDTLKKRTAIIADLSPIAHNPNDIVGFVDLGKVAIDENGGITGGWEEQKAELLKSKPYMFKAVSTNPNQDTHPSIFGNISPNPNTQTPPNNGDNKGDNGIRDFAKLVAKEATNTKFGSDTYFGQQGK